MLNSEKDFVNELDVFIKDSNEKTYIMEKRWNNTRTIAWSLTDLFDFLFIVLLVVMLRNNFFDIDIALVLHNYSNNVIYIYLICLEIFWIILKILIYVLIEFFLY